MQYSVERSAGVHVVRVDEAKLTYPILSSFFAGIQGLVEGGARKVVIDLAKVTYIDSASIGCLMDIHRLLSDKGGAVRLCGLQSRVGTMLSMTGVHKIVDIVPDVAAALAAFGPRAGEGNDA